MTKILSPCRCDQIFEYVLEPFIINLLQNLLKYTKNRVLKQLILKGNIE